MAAPVPILATPAGLPIYIPPSAESGSPVRTCLIERLKEGLSAPARP
ncbi:MAG TPA: hypothetical protein VHO49_13265 [Anaerolineales bacterium]|nr:hypothetical protein [Anaerolineales bacterium]